MGYYDKDICKCGKASADYEVIGEDLFGVTTINTVIYEGRYCRICICKDCGDKYSDYDPCMTKILKQN